MNEELREQYSPDVFRDWELLRRVYEELNTLAKELLGKEGLVKTAGEVKEEELTPARQARSAQVQDILRQIALNAIPKPDSWIVLEEKVFQNGYWLDRFIRNRPIVRSLRDDQQRDDVAQDVKLAIYRMILANSENWWNYGNRDSGTWQGWIIDAVSGTTQRIADEVHEQNQRERQLVQADDARDLLAQIPDHRDVNQESGSAVIDDTDLRERDVVTRYYFREQTLEQIAQDLGISVSRVNAIHGATLQRLRIWLRIATDTDATTLDHLSPEERDVVTRYHFEKNTLEEIAQGLGTSVSRVQMLHRSALERLRIWLRIATHTDSTALDHLPPEERGVAMAYYFGEKTFEEITEELGISMSRAQMLHRSALERLSIWPRIATHTHSTTLDQVPPQERYVVTQYFFGEKTLKEIAQELDITVSRVKKLHCLALDRLRIWLRVPCWVEALKRWKNQAMNQEKPWPSLLEKLCPEHQKIIDLVEQGQSPTQIALALKMSQEKADELWYGIGTTLLQAIDRERL